MSDQERADLARRAKAGDVAARNALVEELLPLFYHIADQLDARRRDDLVQHAVAVVLAGFHNYEPDRVKPESYFGRAARMNMLGYLRDDHTVTVSTTSPARMSDENLAYLHRARRTTRLDAPVGRGGKGTYYTMTVDPRATCPRADAERRETIYRTRRAVRSLPPKLRIIVEYRLEGWTLREVGALLGFGRERARQLEAQAVEKLRRWLGRYEPTI